MATAKDTKSVLTPTIILPEGFFATLRAQYEEAAKVASNLKSQHDAAFDLLSQFGQEIPAGVERIEKRGRKASAEASEEVTTK